jgi:hypothetical protein
MQAGAKFGRTTTLVDKIELRSKILQAFTEKERYTIKELMLECHGVPGLSGEKDVRELLEEFDNRVAKGPYKNYYKLKGEFRDYAQQVQVGVQSSSGTGGIRDNEYGDGIDRKRSRI